VNRPDIHDLGSLLEQLRERHAVVYYGAVALMACGVIGIFCLLDQIAKWKAIEVFPR